VLADEFAEAQMLVQLTNQNQATIGGDTGILEIDFETGVQRELKGGLCFSPTGH
jgi:hypothetical protein